MVSPMMNEDEEYSIRQLTTQDQSFLWEMLYQSLYVREGDAPFQRSVVGRPEIAKYVRDWGRRDDTGFVAVYEGGQRVGAVWLRLLTGDEKGFGYVDEHTPELGLAVLPEYRGRGIGTRLLARLIRSVEGVYENISLSVSVGNPALRLYQRMGFEVCGGRGDSITMKRKLSATVAAQIDESFDSTTR